MADIVWDDELKSPDVVWDDAKPSDVIWDEAPKAASAEPNTIPTPSGYDWGTEDSKDLRRKKNQVSGVKGVVRGLKEGYGIASQIAGRPFMGAAAIGDELAGVVAGKPVTVLQDVAGKHLLDPGKRIEEEYKLKPGEEYTSTGAEIASRIAKDLPSLVVNLGLGGGPASTLTREAFPVLSTTAQRLITHLSVPIATAVPMATQAQMQTYTDLVKQGVDSSKAMLLAEIDGLKTLTMGAAPLSTEGRLLSRAAQGAGQGVVQAKASANINNLLLDSEYPKLHQEPTIADYGVAAGTQAILAGVLGRYAKESDGSKAQEAYAKIKEDLGNMEDTFGARAEFADAINKANKAADDVAWETQPGIRARIKANDQVAQEQGWTGQEPGIGKGEILQDVDTASAKNPFLTGEQLDTANTNADLGKGPGYGEMGFQFPKTYRPVWPTSPDAALYKAIESASRSANAKGSLEKAKAKSDAAADLIVSDLTMAKEGVPLVDQGALKPAETPAIDKAAAEWQAFLDATRKTQGGHLDLTGLGDNALIKAADKFAKNFATTLKQMPARLGRIKYWMGDVHPWLIDSRTGLPYPMFHGTTAVEGNETVNSVASKDSSNAFTEFKITGDIGFHVGSIISAERFTKGGKFEPLPADANANNNVGYIMPVVVRAKNPYIMQDLGGWHPLKIINHILELQAAMKKFGKYNSIKDMYDSTLFSFEFFNPKLTANGINTLRKMREEITAGDIDLYDAYAGIRQLLKSEGFDSIAYQNIAEVYNSATSKDAPLHPYDPGRRVAEPTGANMSWILFDPSQIKSTFSKAFDPRTNKMSGYIDLSVVSDVVDKVKRKFGIKSSDVGMALTEKHNADLFNSPDEMLSAHPPENTSDLPKYGKNIPTTNQLKALMDHPWFNWVWSNIGKAKREANTRFSEYADALEPTFNLSRKDQLLLFKKLTDIQKPDLQGARENAEGTNTREQFLLDQGMEPYLVPHAIRVLDVLKHAFIKDNDSTARVGRDAFAPIAMYFPKTHSGKYNLILRSKENDLKYATGFDSGVDAQKVAAQLKEQYKDAIESGDLILTVNRNHFGASSDMFAVMALQDGLPQSIKNIASGIDKQIEVAKRTFELERSKQDIGGYIGEIIKDENTKTGRTENDKLLNMLQNRLRSSYDWEVRSKIIEQIKTPLFDSTVLNEKPEFKSYVGQLIARELGHDIGANKIEVGMQKALEDASKGLDKLFFSRKNDYESKGDLALISPRALQESAQAWTYFTSILKLSLNPPVLVANATAMPLVVLDGARTAAKMRLGQHNALAAYMDTLAFVGHKDQAATAFMEKAAREGMIEPHISDTYDLAETSEHQAKNKLDTMVNYARNQVEKGTNYTAILYYYNFFRRAMPNLKPEALEQLVFDTARSYTGDYSLQAGPLMFSQAGSLGRLMTNFAKWKWNQIGRFADDLKDAKNGHLTPIVLNLATQTLVGGIYGTAGAVDYEALRRLGQITKLWDWKPFSMWFDEVQDGAKEKLGLDPASMEWARRGLLNEGMAAAGKGLGFEAMPDISGTMRHSSALEAPTVAVKTAYDIFVDGLPAAMKWLWQTADNKTTGVNTEDKEKVITMLPTVFAGPVRHAIEVNEKFGDISFQNLSNPGEIITNSKFNDKGIYKRSQEEELLSMLNFRTAKENNYLDKAYQNSWERIYRAKQVSERVKGILANAENEAVFADNIDELATIGGLDTVKNIRKQLIRNETDKSLTADEQTAFTLLRTLDPIKKQFMLERMNRLLESHNTSSNR